MTNNITPDAQPLYTESDYQRRQPSLKPDQAYRSAFRRDYARLIHSAAFRRLQGKTQLYPGHESDFFRNRLTHSLEVAQIAKAIALRLNNGNSYFQKCPIDCDLVEFAGLAHDLGHPPFGHNGEAALDQCMRNFGGFEGNAHTLRLLTVIEKKETSDGNWEGISKEGKDVRLGLNLAYRTLASILKYDSAIPLSRVKTTKLVKGYFKTEAALVSDIRQHVAPHLDKKVKLKTIECQIMDLADDIAYSTYDLEDALKGGFIDPLYVQSELGEDEHLLRRVFEKVRKECESVTQEDVIRTVVSIFSAENGEDNNSSDIPLHAVEAYSWSKRVGANGYVRTAFTSELVDQFIEGIEVDVNEAYPALSIVTLSDAVKRKVEILKHLNYELMIMSPRLKTVEFRGYDVVSSIFGALDEDDGHLLLPRDYREYYQRLRDTDARKRLICDFVAGMTDRYAVEFYGRLTQGEQSIFKPF